MNLQQSIALSEMRRLGLPTAPKLDRKTADWLYRTFRLPEDSLASDEFMLLDVPLHSAAMPHTFRNDNAVLAAMRASVDSACSVVLDINKKNIGKMPTGYAPPVIVLNGFAAVQAARLAGRETIRTWIGKLAAQKLNLIHADHQLSSGELGQKIQQAHNDSAGIDDHGNGPMGQPVDYSDRPQVGEVFPMEGYHIVRRGGQDFKQKHSVDLPSRKVKLVGKPQPVKQKYVAMNADGVQRGMKIDQAAALQGFGGGNASGPPYSSGLGTQPAAERTRISAKKKKTMKSFAGTEMTDEAYLKHRGATNSEMRKRFEDGGSKMRTSGLSASGGYVGYEKGSNVLQRKFKGGSKSEMPQQLEAAIAEFEAAVDAGDYVPGMKNTAPPGMEDVVQALKRKYGEKSATPFKIAWHMHQKNGKK